MYKIPNRTDFSVFNRYSVFFGIPNTDVGFGIALDNLYNQYPKLLDTKTESETAENAQRFFTFS